MSVPRVHRCQDAPPRLRRRASFALPDCIPQPGERRRAAREAPTHGVMRSSGCRPTVSAGTARPHRGQAWQQCSADRCQLEHEPRETVSRAPAVSYPTQTPILAALFGAPREVPIPEQSRHQQVLQVVISRPLRNGTSVGRGDPEGVPPAVPDKAVSNGEHRAVTESSMRTAPDQSSRSGAVLTALHAEAVGFEPTVTSLPRRFSRPFPSAARARLPAPAVIGGAGTRVTGRCGRVGVSCRRRGIPG